MSGPTEYSIDELKKFVKTLEDYSKNHGIFTAKINHEVEKVINLTAEQIRALTPDECYEKSYTLHGYCNYVQSILNKHTSVLEWCCDCLNKIVTKESEQFSQYMKWEQKIHAVIQNDDFAQKIWTAKTYAQGQVTWLSDKIRDMRKMADILSNCGKRKTYA